ncbi:UNVERIFIED_CONTAM: putative lipase [Sesamum radiatum]|uniref:Lipase n=1 Tax=Sesamum radiatum TaxID=300843 RepID=A0AAW2KFA2_SESRA
MAIGGRSGEEANRDADVAISTVKYHSTNSALISSFSLNYKYHTHKWRPTPTRLCFVAVADYFPIAVGTPIPILSTTIITHPLLLLLASLPLLIPPTIAQPITGNSSISPEAAANHLYNLTAYAYLIFSLWAYLHLAGVKSIWKRKSLKAEAMSKTQGNLSSPRAITKVEDKPEHLIVLVHGILASPSDWTYFEAELKRRLGKKFLIHASSCNTYTKTFTGIDGAGKRLADEVMHIVKKTESLKKISFLAHSLGGLIARYAIAVLYTPNVSYEQTDDTAASPATNFKPFSSNDGLIAGLEGINFITLATPHLGVRGNKQLPFLLGLPFLEKLAAPMAPIFTGQTGSQLFLTDGNPDKPPLLLRMTMDCDDGKFISALGTFQRRVLYANVSYDQEMIRGLQRLGWIKVDVSFRSAFWPFFAHYNIHVKNEWLHNAGAGVVAHVADMIKQQDSAPPIGAGFFCGSALTV